MRLRNALLKACGCSVPKVDTDAAQEGVKSSSGQKASCKIQPKVTRMSVQEMYRSFGRRRNLYNQYTESTSARTPPPIFDLSNSTVVVTPPVPVPRVPTTLLSLPVELKIEILRSLLVVQYHQTLQTNSEASRQWTQGLPHEVDGTADEASRGRSVQTTIDERIGMDSKGQCHACANLEPSFSNELHNSVLRVSHQLYFEAMDVMLENRFVFVTATHDLVTDLLFMQLLDRFALQRVGIVLNGHLPKVKPLLTLHLSIAGHSDDVEGSRPERRATYIFSWQSLRVLRRVLVYYAADKLPVRSIHFEFHHSEIRGLFTPETMTQKLVFDPLWPYLHKYAHHFSWQDIRESRIRRMLISQAKACWEAEAITRELVAGCRWSAEPCISIFEGQLEYLRGFATTGVVPSSDKYTRVPYSELGWEVLAHRALHDMAGILEIHGSGTKWAYISRIAGLRHIVYLQLETTYLVALIHLNATYRPETGGSTKRTGRDSAIEALTHLQLLACMVKKYRHLPVRDRRLFTMHGAALTFETYARLMLPISSWSHAMLAFMEMCPHGLLQDNNGHPLSNLDKVKAKLAWMDGLMTRVMEEKSRWSKTRAESTQLEARQKSAAPGVDQVNAMTAGAQDWQAKMARELTCRILLPELRRHFGEGDLLERLRVPSLHELGSDDIEDFGIADE